MLQLFFIVSLACSAGIAMNEIKNSEPHSSSTSEGDGSASFEEEPLSMWSQRMDLEDFPDPHFLPIDRVHLKSEDNFRRFWWNQTGREIKHFNKFTPVSQSSSSAEDDNDKAN